MKQARAGAPTLLAGKYVGLISGTSMDGIDACLVELHNDGIELLNFTGVSYPKGLRKQLAALAATDTLISLDDFGALDVAVGECFALAVAEVCEGVSASEIIAVGSHGQTVRHRPEGKQPFTLQIGDPNVIAARSGIDTVADFRRQDVALGGQGAPLAPLFHAWVLRDQAKPLGILNLGGIANLTIMQDDAPTLGFDTGPANALMDAWIRRCKDKAFDAAGHWAQSGTVSEPVLQTLLKDPYFAMAAPKSTGIEYFNLQWLTDRIDVNDIEEVDLQATLLELTAQSIAAEVQALGSPLSQLLVCGGGARNQVLINRIGELSRPIPVSKTDELGLPADWVEAMTFAWLAARYVAGVPSDVPSVTGAARPIVLGSLTRAG